MSSPGGDPSARLSHPEEIREIQVAIIKKNTAINMFFWGVMSYFTASKLGRV